MLNVVLNNIAALLSLTIFVLGNGLFQTFIASVLTSRNESSVVIGLMSTCLGAGLVIGSFRIERIIARVAHIRAYALFASIMAVVSLLHGIFDNVYLWLFFRFIAGIATAGIFVVIESWLLCQSNINTRGQILSLYMVTYYASQSLSQLLLKIDYANSLFMFSLISIASSLSVIPLSLTKAVVPIYSQPSTLNPISLYKQCASGMFGCFSGGLIIGTIYALFPVFLLKTFSTTDAVANYMFMIIMGGMLLQYPIGKLSDIIERRVVLLAVGISCIVISILMLLSINHSVVFLILCGLLGGFVFTIYPVSISHACDALEPHDIVSGTQTLLLTYSLGAMLGPLITPVFMQFSFVGIFIYYIVVSLLLVTLLTWRKKVKLSTPQEEPFITYPQNTPIGNELDPRGDVADDS